MLKKMSIKKIMISSLAILILLIIYLIPDNRKEIELSNNGIEYVYNNIDSKLEKFTNIIYFLPQLFFVV